MGPADVAAAARLILRAGGSNAPRRSERLAYAARQAWQRSRGRYVEALATYRRVGEQLACVETGEGPLYVPASLGRDELAALLRYTYDPAAWHRYDGPWAPLPDGAVVVDCGASVGLWASTAAARARHLVLVEPQSSYCDALERTFAERLRAGTAELHCCALGAVDGDVSLAGSGLTAKVAPEGRTVPLRRLDALLGGRCVDYVKADVEGAELTLVEGALETIRLHRPTLALTVYHAENDWRSIRDVVLDVEPGYRWRTRGLTPEGKPVLLLLVPPESPIRGV